MADKRRMEDVHGTTMYTYSTPYVLSPIDCLYVEESIIDFLPFFAEIQSGRPIEIIEGLGGEVMVIKN